MAKLLKADSSKYLNGVKVNEFLLTNHNPNNIAMPTAKMNYAGVTIHNTDDLDNVNDDAEQYTRATYNGNMKDVRVHYYVDDNGAWQNLPLTLQGWHAGDGNGKGNKTTVAIECIMKGSSGKENEKAEDNCAKLAAYLLFEKGLGIDKLYTHTHWLNVKAGRTGTVDGLNTTRGNFKYCPAYILPHWSDFKAKVEKYLNALKGNVTEKQGFKAKDKVKLSNTPLYLSATVKTKSTTKTGTFYIWSEEVINGRIRVTTKTSYCGKSGKVTGWVNLTDVTTATTSNAVTSKPTQSVTYFKKYTGKSVSIVDALKAIGEKSTFAYRLKIANKNGIILYTGSSKQNTKLLDLLKKGKLVKP